MINAHSIASFRKYATRVILLLTLLLPSIAWNGVARAQNVEPGYFRIDLVSSGSIWTPNWDSSLVNPWGIACPSDKGPWWVADEGRGRATLYTGDGIAYPGLAPLVVMTPAGSGGAYDYSAPTGMVFNGTDDFDMAPGMPGRFIFATRDGVIAAYNGDVDRRYAVIMRDDSPKAMYTGIAIASRNGENALYAANFSQKRVEVFDSHFRSILLESGAFTDALISDNFSPYNIQNIGGYLLVSYARPSPDGRDAVPGEGSGFIDLFDGRGNLIMRLEHGSWMNAPWGMILAPDGFGPFSNRLLVANSGSGQIAAFDFDTGAFAGYLPDETGDEPLIISGLHALGFGNGDLAGPVTTLYFSSGFHDRVPNLFGKITTSSPAGMPRTVIETGKLLY